MKETSLEDGTAKKVMQVMVLLEVMQTTEQTQEEVRPAEAQAALMQEDRQG